MKNYQLIKDFFNSIELNYLNINDYITEDYFEQIINSKNPYLEILEILEDNNAFDIEIIYYSNAIDYLKNNDCSLTDSIEIALEYGYELKDINSEILASLLASRITYEAFQYYEDEINDFFNQLEQN